VYSFEYDDKTGILRIRVVGPWTLAEIERYRSEASVQFPLARQKAGSLRLLLDNVRGTLLQQSLVEPMLQAGMSNSRRDDRVAMIVASSLIKLQTKRVFGEQHWAIFISEEAARLWLTAHDEQSGQRAAAG
jgi:hypothetical protein